MSIIEETLRNLQEEKEKEDVHQDVPGAPVEEKSTPMDIKPVRSRKFVVISIYLALFGLGAYYGLEKYQEKLNKKTENLNFNSSSLTSITTPIAVLQKEVSLFENTGVGGPSHEIQATYVDEVLKVGPDQKEAEVDQKIPGTSMRDNLNTEQTTGPPLSENQGLESSQNDVSDNNVLPIGTVVAVVSYQDTDASAVSEETKQELDTEEHPVSVNQSESKQLPIEPVDDLVQSEEKPVSSLLEENIFGKQLKQARHLINIGSYNDAIDILKPIIDRQEETWDTYLLMGAA
ncbi:MAG: hypothetical protein GY808_01860, partial [Gammaproteobacteria bacterium]|nr:hypothetical protein [Gammaproteobacteria bacterium]